MPTTTTTTLAITTPAVELTTTSSGDDTSYGENSVLALDFESSDIVSVCAELKKIKEIEVMSGCPVATMEHFYQPNTYTITIKLKKTMSESDLKILIEQYTGLGSVLSINPSVIDPVETRSSKTLIIVLSSVGGVLLLAFIIYFALFYKRG